LQLVGIDGDTAMLDFVSHPRYLGFHKLELLEVEGDVGRPGRLEKGAHTFHVRWEISVEAEQVVLQHGTS
jgi:hypothetical protein